MPITNIVHSHHNDQSPFLFWVCVAGYFCKIAQVQSEGTQSQDITAFGEVIFTINKKKSS